MRKLWFMLLLLGSTFLLIACSPANNQSTPMMNGNDAAMPTETGPDGSPTETVPAAAPTETTAAEAPTATTPAETPVPVTGDDSGYPNDQLLVEVDWLAENLDDPDIRIVDIRDRGSYDQGHIPGAAHLPLDAIITNVDGVPFRFDEAGVQQALSQAGIQPETTVIIYDDLGMMNSARLFWTLEYAGHEDARVLHGGWNAWVEAGGEESTNPQTYEASDYPIDLQPEKLVTAEELVDKLEDPDVVIVDSRSPQEYTGEVRLSDRGGHIPGAINLVWLELLEGGDAVYTIEPDWQEQLMDEDVERLKSAEEIQALLDEHNITPNKEIITYCQTLWRGAHTYYVLRLMGFEQVRGYDGAWAEWGNRDDLPVAEGEEPFDQ